MFTEKNVIMLANEILKLGKTLKNLSQNKQFTVEKKSDNSSVTSADLYADAEIKKIIINNFGNIPILSEEDTQENQQDIAKKEDYFITDPIDGTESFIAGDDFCVNIAYCNKNIPIFGLISLPMQNIVYYTLNNKIYSFDGDIIEIKLQNDTKNKIVIATGKRSFIGKQKILFDNFIDQKNYKIDGIITKNAGIKYLSTILGISDVAINFGPVRDWDLAMIYAIGKAHNFCMTDKNGDEILFGKGDMSHKNGIIFNHFDLKTIH